jgi:hypothetical protein
MHRTRNAAYGQPYRGFESLPLRHPLPLREYSSKGYRALETTFKTWMPATSAGMTIQIPPDVSKHFGFEIKSRHCRRALIESDLVRSSASHRRRQSVAADAPGAALQHSIGLLDRDDEDFRARLDVVLVARHVSHDRRVSGDDILDTKWIVRAGVNYKFGG